MRIDCSNRLRIKIDVNSKFIFPTIVAVGVATQGITIGEDTVSALMFADDSVGISQTPEGWQKQRKY